MSWHPVRDTGKMIYSMALAKKFGLTALNMKDSMWKEESMEKATTSGLMVVPIKVIGQTTRSKEKAYMNG